MIYFVIVNKRRLRLNDVGFSDYKKAIAAGLKELTKQKSFEKITVSDITQICA